MKVLCTTSSFTAPFPPEVEVVKNPHGRRLSEAEVAELIREHKPDGLIAGVEPLTRAVLEGAKGLRGISRCGVGLDSVDLDAARELGVAVRNTPEAPVASVAELTVALILALLRHVPVADAALRRGEWPRIKGGLLEGKTVGLVGCGRIGSAVAQRLSGFGCKLIGFDPALETHPLCTLVSLDRVIAEADILTLHSPLVEATRHLIGAAQLEAMKTSALLVNTARGGLVDTAALVTALIDGSIAGAALDVFEEEPYTGPLTTMTDKTVLTSHIASSAREARQRMEEEAVANLMEALSHS